MQKSVRSVLFIAIGVLLLAAILWVVNVNQQPRQFTLQVTNQSGLLVDQVRLFGTALENEAVLLNLPPQADVELQTAINTSGTLRVEITQGLNRIDSPIVEDTRLLTVLSQQLTIEPGNRFLLSVNE